MIHVSYVIIEAALFKIGSIRYNTIDIKILPIAKLTSTQTSYMHRKVRQEYEKHKFEVPANPADTNQEIFRRKTKRARPEDIKVYINQVWRTAQGPKKDYIFYERKVVIPDLVGNEDTDTELLGKYEMPRFRNIYNNQTGDAESIALAGFETQYDIPYSKEKMEEILTEAEIERDGDDKPVKVPVDATNTIFTLSIGGRKYGGFSADDFINRSFDELTQLALYGQLAPNTVQNIKPSDLRANDDYALKQRRLKQAKEEEEAALEEAYVKVHELEEARRKANEERQKEQEEEAKKRQEVVDQQSEKRVVRTEQTISFDKEAPMSTQEQKEASGEVPPQRRKAGLRPEREEIGEEVGFVLQRVEDQNVNEDEEIKKGFEEQEKSKQKKGK
jgi:hypothetical protein